jgi:hypothetical protein
MHACLCPCPCLGIVSISSTVRLLHGSVPLLCVLQHGLFCYIDFFGVPSINWSVLLAARVDCCSGSLSAVGCICDLRRCHVMTRVATLHQQRPGGVGDTSPAPGRLVAHILLCLCCVCVFSGNFLRAAQSPYLLGHCLAGPGVILPYRRGRSRPVLFCCIHVYASCSPFTVRLQLACVSSCALQ